MITLSELLDGACYDIDHVKGALKRGFEDVLGVKVQRSLLAGEEIELAQRLNERMIRGGGFGSGRNGWIGGGHHVLQNIS